MMNFIMKTKVEIIISEKNTTQKIKRLVRFQMKVKMMTYNRELRV